MHHGQQNIKICVFLFANLTPNTYMWLALPTHDSLHEISRFSKQKTEWILRRLLFQEAEANDVITKWLRMLRRFWGGGGLHCRTEATLCTTENIILPKTEQIMSEEVCREEAARGFREDLPIYFKLNCAV